MRTSLAPAILAATLAGPASAQAPLSAIDWLSESIAVPVNLEPQPGVQPPGSAVAPSVTTLPLGAPMPDGVGLVPTETAGLPADLWGASTSADLVALLRSEPLDMGPSLRALLKRILVAELDPPVDADQTGALLMARIDKLLTLGALDEAEALLDLTGTSTPELFRRRFDVALLTGAEDRACGELRGDPGISPTYPARIFCLARGGDWHTAAVTLETANALGLLDEEEDQLLAYFLHPELSEDTGPLRPPSRPSPLIFRLMEAIGEPLSTGGLPIAFAQADLRPTSGWKAQLDAAERLARIGAIDPNRLMGLYTERRPSASGGVWERAGAVQALDRALESGRSEDIDAALRTAWTRMSAVGLAPVLSALFAERLAGLDLAPPARDLAFRMALLTPSFADLAGRYAPRDAEDEVLAALATGDPAAMPARTPLETAIRDGFAADGPSGRLRPLIEENRAGEALLRAIALFAGGTGGNYDDIRDAISTLRAMGQEETARRASLDLLILGASR